MRTGCDAICRLSAAECSATAWRTALSGMLGTFGVTLSNANAGLVAATGVASRSIAFAIAGLFALLALQPRLLGILTLMPRPVMAATMLFIASFIMISGIQIITMRVLDGRRTLVIGMGLTTFFGATVYHTAFSGAPQWAQPIIEHFGSGDPGHTPRPCIPHRHCKKRVTMTINPRLPPAVGLHLIEQNHSAGTRSRDITNRIEFAVQQALEAIVAYCDAKGPIVIELSFDEFVITADITYDGAPNAFSRRPTEQRAIAEKLRRRLSAAR